MSFKINQQVVCIKEDNKDIADPLLVFPFPKINEIVTIESFYTDELVENWLVFKEYPEYISYDPKMFKPLHYDFAENVLKTIKEDIYETNI